MCKKTSVLVEGGFPKYDACLSGYQRKTEACVSSVTQAPHTCLSGYQLHEIEVCYTFLDHSLSHETLSMLGAQLYETESYGHTIQFKANLICKQFEPI